MVSFFNREKHERTETEVISVSVVFFVWLNQNDSFSSATLVALNVKRSRLEWMNLFLYMTYFL